MKLFRVPPSQETLAQGKWKQYDYIALRFDKKQAVKMTAVSSKIPLVPVRIFSNQRGDQVLIYKCV